MIPVDLDMIDFGSCQAFIDAANAAQIEINQEPDSAKRKALIDKHRPKWVAFREVFNKLPTGDKCWYTECRNPGTDDDVDHFRPKKEVAESDAHGGYYWKALTWKNFRLSCHRANRLRTNPNTNEAHGKADHFPLLDEAGRARTPADNLDLEQPLLLDPCNPLDPPKLSFNTDGTVAIASRYEADMFAIQQVEASRKHLHLDWPVFVDDRKRLFNEIYREIATAQEYADRFLNTQDVAAGESLKKTVSNLRRMLKEDQPYSAAAKAFISVYRSHWWVEDLVLGIAQSAEGHA